jgi:membrane associated rhomboid family serine protease
MMSSESPEIPPVLPVYDEAALREARVQAEFFQRLRSNQPRVTIALIAACAAVFGLECLWAQQGENLDGLYSMGAMVGEAARQGEWWRLWSATFLHIGPMHIIMNMLVLWSLGRQMEAMFGSWRFLILYALSGLAGNIPYLFTQQETVGAGASGAIWGILAGMYAFTLRPRGQMPLAIAQRARRGLMQTLFINLAISFLPGIGLWAHLGGGLVGFSLVFSGVLGGHADEPAEWPGRRSVGQHWTTWVALALSAGMLGSVVWALVVGKPWVQ